MGGFLDLVHESFGGTHDFIGGNLSGYYDQSGNARRGLSDEQIQLYGLWSGIALIPSAPFAFSEALPVSAWQAISVLVR